MCCCNITDVRTQILNILKTAQQKSLTHCCYFSYITDSFCIIINPVLHCFLTIPVLLPHIVFILVKKIHSIKMLDSIIVSNSKNEMKAQPQHGDSVEQQSSISINAEQAVVDIKTTVQCRRNNRSKLGIFASVVLVAGKFESPFLLLVRTKKDVLRTHTHKDFIFLSHSPSICRTVHTITTTTTHHSFVSLPSFLFSIITIKSCICTI